MVAVNRLHGECRQTDANVLVNQLRFGSRCGNASRLRDQRGHKCSFERTTVARGSATSEVTSDSLPPRSLRQFSAVSAIQDFLIYRCSDKTLKRRDHRGKSAERAEKSRGTLLAHKSQA